MSVTTEPEVGHERHVKHTGGFSIKVDPATGQKYMAVSQKGRALLLNPFTNKGSGFTMRERAELDLHGLVPPAVCTLPQQLVRTYENFQAKTTLDLKEVHSSVEPAGTATRRCSTAWLEHIDEMMPAHTPVVGEACQKFSHIWRRGPVHPLRCATRSESILENAEIGSPSVIVDRTANPSLGLGDQGAGGMGTDRQASALRCARAFPTARCRITIDAGTGQPGAPQRPRLSAPPAHPWRGAASEVRRRLRGGREGVPARGPAVGGLPKRASNAIHQPTASATSSAPQRRHPGHGRGDAARLYLRALRITASGRDQRVVFAGAGASAQGISDPLVAAHGGRLVMRRRGGSNTHRQQGACSPRGRTPRTS